MRHLDSQAKAVENADDWVEERHRNGECNIVTRAPFLANGFASVINDLERTEVLDQTVVCSARAAEELHVGFLVPLTYLAPPEFTLSAKVLLTPLD